MTVKELLPHYKEISNLLHKGDYKAINAILDKTIPEGVLSIGLLRLTFLWRDKLPSWIHFRDKVEEELTSKGFDSKIVLIGLLKGE